MEQWTYVERKKTKILFGVVFVSGELFLIAILIFLFKQNPENISPVALPVSLVALLLWSGIFQYFFSNFPKCITVSSEGLLVAYSEKRKQLYAWENVFLGKIGLKTFPLIFIKNKAASALLNVPRVVFLDGNSKEYKELVKRISMQCV